MKLTQKQAQKIIKTLDNRKFSEVDCNYIVDALKNLIGMTGRELDEGVLETPYRVMKAMLEQTVGYCEDPKQHLTKTFNVECDDLVLVKDIAFSSTCEHHLMPFSGKVHIAYIPDGKITGLSKFPRMVKGYSKRFQVQERLTNDIVNAIEEVLSPAFCMVIVEATHSCVECRGVENIGSSTITSAIRGNKKDVQALRNEVMSLIK